MPIQKFLLPSREDADRVWDALQIILNEYGFVSLADVKELVGFKTSYDDQRLGWDVLGNLQVEQTHKGFMLCLPEPGAIESPNRSYREHKEPTPNVRDEALSRDDQIRIAALSAAVRLNPEFIVTSSDVVVRALHFEAYLKGEEV